MIIEWLSYSLILGALLTVAALLLEVGLRAVGRPTRWVWLASSALTVATPLLLLMRPADAPLAPLAAIAPLPPLEFLALGEDAGSALPSVRSVLLVMWTVSSLLVLAVGGLAAWRLAQRRRGWATAQVDGVDVLVSRRTGPAVVGVRRFEIVIPEWALSLSERERAYMLLHEQEHARAGDPRVLLAGGLLVAAVPWNLPVWYQLRRLIVAVEVDCDRRVLAAGGDITGYAALLLDFGQRLSNTMLPVAAFAAPRSILETRIRHMMSRRPRRGVARFLAAAIASVAVVTVAAAMPAPRDAMSADETLLQTLAMNIDRMVAPSSGESELRNARDESSERPAATVMAVDTPPRPLESGPMFTPYTVQPKLLNPELAAQTLQVLYPSELRSAGIGGTVNVWFFIDETGKVRRVQLQQSSGHASLDAAGLLVAETMEFSPALNRDQPVKVWVAMPIMFRNGTPGSAGGARPSSSPSASATQAATRANPPSAQILPQPFTKQPELLNAAEIGAGLQRLYPPLLRDAGIGGVVSLQLYVDVNGRVQRAQVIETAGHQALDEAALKVVDLMRFAPALNGEVPVAAWFSVPVSFRSS